MYIYLYIRCLGGNCPGGSSDPPTNSLGASIWNFLKKIFVDARRSESRKPRP